MRPFTAEKLAVNPAASIQIGTGGRHKKEVSIPSKADVKAILTEAGRVGEGLEGVAPLARYPGDCNPHRHEGERDPRASVVIGRSQER